MVRTLLALALVLGSSGLLGEGQTPARSGQRFRTGVEFVTLDVSVLGRDRRPVRGLTAADFVVLEDGVEQTIETFSEVALPPRAPAPADWWTSVPEDVKTSTAIDSGRLLLVVIDDAHIRADHRYVTKRIANQIVDRMAPGDRMALIYTRVNSSSQDFTDERRLIREAIDRFTAGGESIGFGSSPSRPSGNSDEASLGSGCDYFTRQTLDTLENIAKYAGALPGRRKALFLIGELGVPTGPGSACFMDGLDIFREAARANVNIYPISPSAMEDGFDMAASTADEAAAGREQALDLRDGLRALADNTGGFAIVNTNEFERGIELVYAENASYYLLGYATASKKAPGKFRDIEVKVRQTGLQVRVRDGYVPPKATKAERAAPKPERAAISGFVPSSDVVLSATVVPMKGTARDGRTALAAVMEVRPPVAGSDPVKDVLSVEAVLLDANGNPKDRMETEIPISFTPRAGALAAYRVPFVLHAKPGRHQLRFGVASRSAGKAGSIYYDMDVPEYGDDPIELSGLALFARVDAPSVKPDALGPALPLTPSLRRSFGGSEAVRAAVRVYARGARPPVLVVARLDGAGGEVWKQALEVSPPDPAGTLAVFDLPLSDLAPGPYRVTLTASRGAQLASRVTRFMVR